MLTAFMVFLVVLSNSAGDVFITRGIKKTGDLSLVSPREIFKTAKKILTNRDFQLGVFFLAVSFFSFISVLSWADVSLVVPATSIVNVITVLGARFVLKEEVSAMRWAGTLLVCCGVALVCV